MSGGSMIIDFRLPPPGTKLEPRQNFVLWHVDWADYEKIVAALNEQHVRVTYNRGDLELMSPPPAHELMRIWFGHFMLALMSELNLSFKGMGQTTFYRRDRRCGLEPGDCYYFASRKKVVDWTTLHLERDPPPDLVLELDITRICVDRLSVYAALEVPEVWRFDGEEWHVHLLEKSGEYRESPVSAELPYLPMAEIMPLQMRSLYTGDDRERMDTMRSWARERVLPLYQTWQQQQQSPPEQANP